MCHSEPLDPEHEFLVAYLGWKEGILTDEEAVGVASCEDMPTFLAIVEDFKSRVAEAADHMRRVAARYTNLPRPNRSRPMDLQALSNAHKRLIAEKFPGLANASPYQWHGVLTDKWQRFDAAMKWMQQLDAAHLVPSSLRAEKSACLTALAELYLVVDDIARAMGVQLQDLVAAYFNGLAASKGSDIRV